MQNVCAAGGRIFPISLGERKRITLEYEQKSMEGENKSQVVLVVITPS